MTIEPETNGPEPTDEEIADFEAFIASLFAPPQVPEDLVAHWQVIVQSDENFHSTPLDEKLSVIDFFDGQVRDFQTAVREDVEADWQYVAEQLADSLASASAALRRILVDAATV